MINFTITNLKHVINFFWLKTHQEYSIACDSSLVQTEWVKLEWNCSRNHIQVGHSIFVCFWGGKLFWGWISRCKLYCSYFMYQIIFLCSNNDKVRYNLIVWLKSIHTLLSIFSMTLFFKNLATITCSSERQDLKQCLFSCSIILH